jgi:hypothetical protein
MCIIIYAHDSIGGYAGMAHDRHARQIGRLHCFVGKHHHPLSIHK